MMEEDDLEKRIADLEGRPAEPADGPGEYSAIRRAFKAFWMPAAIAVLTLFGVFADNCRHPCATDLVARCHVDQGSVTRVHRGLMGCLAARAKGLMRRCLQNI